MHCNICFYEEETGDEKFIGIFPPGTTLSSTTGGPCGIYACPKCGNVQFTNDEDYLAKRKSEYKADMKALRSKITIVPEQE